MQAFTALATPCMHGATTDLSYSRSGRGGLQRARARQEVDLSICKRGGIVVLSARKKEYPNTPGVLARLVDINVSMYLKFR
jgi:hypothetical protein